MDKKEEAKEFLRSERGKYIVAQALYEGVKAMKSVPAPHTEHSNISDMEFLLDNLFPHYKEMFVQFETLRTQPRKRR